MMELSNLSVRKAHEMLVNKEVSSIELTSAVLANIQRLDPIIKSYLTVTEEQALEQARQADIRLNSNKIINHMTEFRYAIKNVV